MAVLSDGGPVHLVVGSPDATASIVGGLRRASVPTEIVPSSALRNLEPLGQCGMDGWWVARENRATRPVAGVVLAAASGRFPFLDPCLLDWEDGRPALVAGVLAPGLANLYVLPRSAGHGGLSLVVAMVLAQGALAHPLVDEVMRFVRPSHHLPSARVGRRIERRVRRYLRSSGGSSWWADGLALDGPLAGTRSF